MIETQSASSRNDPIVALLRAESRLGVTGGKTRSEYMFSALPQIADIARSVFHNSANQPNCRSRVPWTMRSGSRAIPCSAAAQQRHKIIHNRVALAGEESVSGVTRGSGLGTN